MDEVVDDQVNARNEQQQDGEIVETAKYRCFFHNCLLLFMTYWPLKYGQQDFLCTAEDIAYKHWQAYFNR